MTELITSFIELIILLIFIGDFYLYKYKFSKKLHLLALFVLFKGIYTFAFDFIDDEFISFTYHLILTLFIIKFFYDFSFSDTIKSFLFSYILIVLVQLPYVMLDTLVFHIDNPNILAFSCMIYSLIASILITKFLPTHKLYELIFKNNKIGLLFIANIFAIFIIVTMYFKINRGRFVDMVIFFAIAIIILISINIVAINQFNTIRKQRKQLIAYEEYFPMIDSLINTVRRRQHHHANEVQAITSLIYTNNDYDSLVKSINEHFEFAKQLDMPTYLLKLNMKLVAGFLYMKEQDAAKQNKFLNIELETFELYSKVPEYILVEIFGILIDNALEATDCGETAFVNINNNNDKIHFTTRNKGFKLTQAHRNNFFTQGYSTKNNSLFSKEHNGLGLPTLKSLVIDQFGGQIVLRNDSYEGTDICFEIIV